MDDTKFKISIDSFMEDHPELEPGWKPILEPVIQGSEDTLKSFILSYIFM